MENKQQPTIPVTTLIDMATQTLNLQHTTLPITTLIDMANHLLKQVLPEQEKIGYCTLIENILLPTSNYNGFIYVEDLAGVKSEYTRKYLAPKPPLKPIHRLTLYNLCIEHHWYTCGTIEQYNNLLNNCRTMTISEIAHDIYLKTDNVRLDTILDILNNL